MRQVTLFSLVLLLLTGCQQQSEDALVIYSGRSKALVEELVDRFEEETGVPAEVRYGSDAQLLATMQEEGDQRRADVFWANTTGALGSAVNDGLLSALPDSLLQRPTAFAPSGGRWVPITTRFRVLAYNTENVQPDELPASIMDLPDMPEYEGRIGWTPSYSSFQDFVTAMRLEHGAEAAREWLNGMQELNPNSYPSNTPMIQALDANEIDIGLTNHYYVLRLKYGDARNDESDPDASVDTYHFETGDIGNLALVTGAGVLSSTDQQENAHRFLSFLLSPEAQSYAAETVHEYPVVPGDASLPDYMLSADSALMLSPDIDFENLRNLDETLQLMREVGLL